MASFSSHECVSATYPVGVPSAITHEAGGGPLREGDEGDGTCPAEPDAASAFSADMTGFSRSVD